MTSIEEVIPTTDRKKEHRGPSHMDKNMLGTEKLNILEALCPIGSKASQSKYIPTGKLNIVWSCGFAILLQLMVELP